MPAGDPELGRSRGDRQLLGNDLKNSNTRSGHARDCPPTPGQAAPGDRRYGLALRAPPPRRPPQPQAPTHPPGVTYVPTHEGHITWDIRREPRHLLRHREIPVNGPHSSVWLRRAQSDVSPMCPNIGAHTDGSSPSPGLPAPDPHSSGLPPRALGKAGTGTSGTCPKRWPGRRGHAIAFTRHTSGRWRVRVRSACSQPVSTTSSRDHVWSPKRWRRSGDAEGQSDRPRNGSFPPVPDLKPRDVGMHLLARWRTCADARSYVPRGRGDPVPSRNANGRRRSSRNVRVHRDPLEINRAWWDGAAAIHGDDPIYDTKALIAGADSLSREEETAIAASVGTSTDSTSFTSSATSASTPSL